MRLALSITETITTVAFYASLVVVTASEVNLAIFLRDPPPSEVAYAITLVACVAAFVFGVASIVVG